MKIRRENGVFVVTTDREYTSKDLHSALLEATGCKNQSAELMFRKLCKKKMAAYGNDNKRTC